MLINRNKLLFCLIIILISITLLSACSKNVEFQISFIVDDDIYATVSTNGSELIKMPNDPKKEGYTFGGWYWDKETWERNFTVNSLLNEPLSSNMSVYAKWDDCTESFTEGLKFFLQSASNSYFVKEYSGIEQKVVIPNTYEGLPVIGINTRAFEGDLNIVEVTIPDSVTSIGLGAFSESISLEKVNIGNNLQILGANAFSNCINLEIINLPESVANVGSEAFYGCSKLKELNIPRTAIIIGANVITGCSSLERLTMPGIKTLKSLVGDDDNNIPVTLKTVSVADGSEVITKDAFINVSNIENIFIPSSVISVGDNAFSNCGIKSITIPDSLTSIGNGIFYNCNSLAEIIIPFAHENIFNKVTEGYTLLYKSTSLRNITITKGTSIGNYLFSGCSNLTSVTIPSSVTSIGTYAFYNCYSLKEVHIKDISAWVNISFYDIYSNPLYYARNLYLEGTLVTDLIIPEGATNIRNYAFYNCSSLTSINIPDSVSNIGSSAFYNCSNLTSINIPDSVSNIGNSAFSNCNSLASIIVSNENTKYYSSGNCLIEIVTKTLILGCKNSIIPTDGSVTIIGSYAFSNCSSLTSIIISDSITSIRQQAFYNCSSLTSITIGSGVISIGSYAFSGCSNLAIYAEAASKPSGWGINWNNDNRPVVWGYTGS